MAPLLDLGSLDSLPALDEAARRLALGMLHTAFSKMEPQLAWSPPEPEAIVGTTHHAGPGNFLAAVRAEGVALDAGFRGFVKRSARRCRVAGELTESAKAAERTVILHHPVLLESEETIDRVAMALEKVVFHLGNS